MLTRGLSPTHTATAETIRAGPWRNRLKSHLRESPVLDPSVYSNALRPQTTGLDLWETTYFRILEGENPVVEWTKGNTLRPFSTG